MAFFIEAVVLFFSKSVFGRDIKLRESEASHKKSGRPLP